MEIIFLIILFFDFAFLNFSAICFIASTIKLNNIKKEALGGLKDVDLSSLGIK